ncbi:hypothetical protein [Stutzerimonas azotifigens]|uniref:hypothetical protein n=1 Tax=Stutzerimonas azotifigens TaxID=291995 RepID=UPI00041F6720|nr:hypothetical protein [Stutzerimonas azotifigens]
MMRIWLWPAVIALTSTLGLIAGLVSEGLGDWLSWLALGLPTLIGLHGLARCRASRAPAGKALLRGTPGPLDRG